MTQYSGNIAVVQGWNFNVEATRLTSYQNVIIQTPPDAIRQTNYELHTDYAYFKVLSICESQHDNC